MLSDHCCCWCCGNGDEDVFKVWWKLYPVISFLCSVGCCTEVWLWWCSCCLFSFLHECWVYWVLYAHVCCELVFPFIECCITAIVCWWFQVQLVYCCECICSSWICWCCCCCMWFCHCVESPPHYSSWDQALLCCCASLLLGLLPSSSVCCWAIPECFQVSCCAPLPWKVTPCCVRALLSVGLELL